MMHRFGGVIRVGLFFGRSYGAVKGFAYNGVEKEVEQKEQSREEGDFTRAFAACLLLPDESEILRINFDDVPL